MADHLLVSDIAAYLHSQGRCRPGAEVSFLAAGEYNANYLVTDGNDRWVLRCNHGSQLGLVDQIGYEYRVLLAVAPSGVTPRPRWCDAHPPGLPCGVLAMDYCPGRPLDYATDLERAAVIFARVHALAPDPELLVQADAVAAIAAESLELLERYPDHARTDVRRLLLDYRLEVLELGAAQANVVSGDPLVMVNTEVNSGNFLLGPQGDWLVDWEKAVVSSRCQDLGHFVAPTSTLWKTETVLSPAQVASFLASYRAALVSAGARVVPEPEALAAATGLLVRTIVLRGLAWCFMAWHEYTRGDRPLAHPATLARMTWYLNQAPQLLAMARRLANGEDHD